VLTDEDKTVLDLEACRFVNFGRKEVEIRERLGMTSTRYFQRLNHLIDQPAALAHSPVLVNRLRRLRTLRARAA
jgi:hypothetical protein